MPVTGIADLHCHPMAHLAFGGAVFAGEPWGPLAQALAHCDTPVLHARPTTVSGGVLKNIIAALVRKQTEPDHGAFGHPGFYDWPTFQTVIHQQMYVDWVRRAYEGGVRLMVALAVNNELLSWVFGRQTRDGKSADPQSPDRRAIEVQVRHLKQFVAANTGWMAFATTAQEAEDAVKNGKLAVVASVEVDSLDTLTRTHRDALLLNPLTAQEIDAGLDWLWSLGVRAMTPLHLTNNSFAGSAIYSDMFNLLNRWTRHAWFDVEPSDDVEFRLGTDTTLKIASQLLLPTAEPFKPPNWVYGHVNAMGLTDAGRTLLGAAMKRGFLIDVDHMSNRATESALAIAETNDYPVMSSHSSFRELGLSRQQTKVVGKLSHEGMKSLDQLERILELGGLVAPITNMHECRAAPGCPVPNDCARTSKTWAQSYWYATRALEDIGKGGVGIGTDFNGLNQQPGPRYGKNAAFGLKEWQSVDGLRTYPVQFNQDQAQRLKYPFKLDVGGFSGAQLDAMLVATRSAAVDFNVDGLATYGQVPDFVMDLLGVGFSPADLEPLFDSTNAFITMWRKAETRSAVLRGP